MRNVGNAGSEGGAGPPLLPAPHFESLCLVLVGLLGFGHRAT